MSLQEKKKRKEAKKKMAHWVKNRSKRKLMTHWVKKRPKRKEIMAQRETVTQKNVFIRGKTKLYFGTKRFLLIQVSLV